MAASSTGPKNEPIFSDLDAPDVAVNPTQAAAYAAKTGNNRVDTAANRTSASGKDVWLGLRWFDTTTNAVYEYISGWVRRHVMRLARGRLATATIIAASPTYTDLITVTATSTGGICSVDFSGALYNAVSGANRTAAIRVTCDGTAVEGVLSYDVLLTGGSTGTAFSGNVESTPGVGSHTWKLQGNGSVASAVGVQAGAVMKITEI